MYILNDYDSTLEKILNSGIRKENRTGVDTLSLFGTSCRYNISEYFPIPSKRKVAYKSIFAELLWMISGSTNTNDLNKLGSKIWDSWKDKDFEQRNNYQDGDLGPIYGNSFTNFGGTYKSNDGFNQVEYLINELKNNKYSRRALINLWDPKVMTTDKVKLPTCHYSFQVLVGENNNLTGILTQRSGDWLPGVSANVYFYSAFLYMIAQQTGYVPYELVHNVADAHVYVNQIDAAKEYLSRGDYKSPKLMLNKASSIFDYKMNDFNVVDYFPGEKIKVPVEV
jgi:thymidylate synthase